MRNYDDEDVGIEREGRVWRWGEDSYFLRWNGLKNPISKTLIKAALFPVAIIFGVLIYFTSPNIEYSSGKYTELAAPNFTQDSPIANLPILKSSTYLGPTKGNSQSTPAIPKISVVNLRSLLDLPVGSEAKAVLVSGASNGLVKARLVTSMLVDSEPVLPEGTTIVGRGISTEERLFVEFSKAIMPTGESVSIRGHGFDVGDKILGLKGSFVSTRTKKMGLAIGFGLIGGMADGMQTSGDPSFWGAPQKRSVRDSALSGASKAALDQSQVYLDEMKNAPNIIEVKQGTEFYLIVDDSNKKEENAQ